MQIGKNVRDAIVLILTPTCTAQTKIAAVFHPQHSTLGYLTAQLLPTSACVDRTHLPWASDGRRTFSGDFG